MCCYRTVKANPDVLDQDELRRLFDQARTTRLYPFVVLATATGCRRGELLALQWPDLDFETGLLTVSKSLEQTRLPVFGSSVRSRKIRAG